MGREPLLPLWSALFVATRFSLGLTEEGREGSPPRRRVVNVHRAANDDDTIICRVDKVSGRKPKVGGYVWVSAGQSSPLPPSPRICSKTRAGNCVSFGSVRYLEVFCPSSLFLFLSFSACQLPAGKLRNGEGRGKNLERGPKVWIEQRSVG